MNNIEDGSYQRTTTVFRYLIGFQIAVAITLMLVSLGIIFIYFLGLLLALVPNSGLMPWISAGIFLYGLIFVGVALIPAFFGIMWAFFIYEYASEFEKRVLKIAVGVNMILLGLGTLVAFVMLVFANLIYQ